MSAVRAVARIRYAPQRLPEKPPQLRAISGGKGTRVATVKAPLQAKSSFGFLLLCGLALLTSLVVVLVLNTNIIKGSYQLMELQTQILQVDQEIQAKQEDLRQQESKSLLERRAREELGLEPAKERSAINITNYVATISDSVIGSVTPRGAQWAAQVQING